MENKKNNSSKRYFKGSYFIKMLFILLGGIFFTQIPSFKSQYYHQLVGHIEELSFQVDRLQILAKQVGKTLPEYIEKFKASTDIDFQNHANFLEAMVNRLFSLKKAIAVFHEVTGPLSCFHSISYIDSKIVLSTYKAYTFSLPLNFDTALWAVGGAFFGYLLFACLIKRFFVGTCR